MKIYTKQGDKGTTSLIGGERVSKCDLRVEAYGTADELMAFTALLADKLSEDIRFESYTTQLRHIESHLMTVSAILAIGKGGEGKVAPPSNNAITYLEQAIDEMQEQLPAITKFTIPGGDERISLCHVCRTVCRRAERATLRAAQEYGTEPQVLEYLNRLSDYYYLLGRTITHITQSEEILWIP